MRWAGICVDCKPDSAEAVSAALFDIGCAGVSTTSKAASQVQGWLPVTDEIEPALLALAARLDDLPSCGLPGDCEITVRHVEDVDWLTEWKKHHRATPIGDRLLIVPSWDPGAESVGRAVVTLDPGMAFGTGSHPTTRLCLDWLEAHPPVGLTVADVGSGSGILAIAAAKLGAARVIASEIDALPRRIAADNVAANGVADVVSVHDATEFEAVCPPCDLVVCNIIAETIAEMAAMLAGLLKPGACLLVSGIVEERAPIVVDALTSQGLVLVEEATDDVWRAMVWRARVPNG